MSNSHESTAPHVVVCGAGAIGAATAFNLCEQGARVSIVEEGEVAGAASGKSGGFLASDWCDGTPLAQLARTSYALHEQLAGRFGDLYDYRKVRTYAVASGNSRSVESGEVGWLGEGFRVRGLLGDEETTAQVHPRKFTQTLINAACKKGARSIQGRVEAVKSNQGRIERVSVDGSELKCDAVVIALGPWSSGALLGLPLPQVYGLKGHSITVTPALELPAQALFVEDMMLGDSYTAPEVVARPDGSVYLCGISEQLEVPAAAEEVKPREDAIEELGGFARSLSPDLSESLINSPAACFRPVYPDGLPRMGPVANCDGAYLASGHSCWGILNAPASGAAMAELILKGRAETVDLRPFDPRRS